MIANNRSDLTRKNHYLLRIAMVLALALSLMASMMPQTADAASAASAKLKAPKSVSVKKAGKNKVKISWKKASKKHKVQVYLKKGKGKYKKVAVTRKSGCKIKKLKAGTTYKLRLRSRYGKKSSAYTKVITFKINKKGKVTIIRKKAAKKTAAKTGKTGKTSETTDSAKTDTTADNTSKSPVTAAKCKLIDLGYAQYVSVAFAKGYNADNTVVTVDGTVINDALTAVTDDGSLAKWEITSLDPAVLTVTSRADKKVSASVKLSSNASPSKPQAVSGGSADYIMGHGPVTVFDYYLTNYDDQGKVRTMPARTTFSTDGKASDNSIRSYAEDAEISADGSGTVVIMFNYKSDADTEWFDAVPKTGGVELVAFDEQMSTINSDLTYTKDTAYPHGSGTVAAVKIPLGQNNFRTNGRYYVRTKSTGHKSALTAINVVNEVAPTMALSENGSITSGQNVHFIISNMVEGIRESIEQVTLTSPSGKTETLAYIDDWFHYGNTGLFVLYNDAERNDGEGINHLTETGTYTVTVSAAGFKTFSKKFYVTASENSSSSVSASVSKTAKGAGVDAITSATASTGTSGSSGGSGGSMVSADLLFNVDLLSNAQIMDKLGMDNEYAVLIAERWQTSVSADYIFNEDGKTFYTYTAYRNAVNDARTEGRYLSFGEYAQQEDAVTTDSRPSRVKAVLEDNKLGDITDKYIGSAALELTAESNEVVSGSDAVFSGDDEYIEAVTSVTKVKLGNLADQTVDFTAKDGRLTIPAKALTLGDNYFKVSADGYRDTEVSVRCVSSGEEVTLSAQGSSHRTGDDVMITADEDGKFMGSVSAVSMIGPDGRTREVLSAFAGGTSTPEYYELGSDRKTLILKGGLFTEAGDYTVFVSSAAYQDKLTVEFTVEQKTQEEIDDSLLTPPAVTGLSKLVKGSSAYGTMTGYDLVFGSDASEYLSALSSNYKTYTVTVNGEIWRRQANTVDAVKGYVESGSKYASTKYFRFSQEILPAEGTNQVVISVDGYEDLTFTVDTDGTVTQ